MADKWKIMKDINFHNFFSYKKIMENEEKYFWQLYSVVNASVGDMIKIYNSYW